MDKSYKIALIGGTGKVGRHIVSTAIKKGFQVRMLVRNPETLMYRDDYLEIVEGQIQDVSTIRKLLKDCNIVINTFGQAPKEAPIYSSVTKNILDIMIDLKISRYIGVSGGSLTINSDKKRFRNQLGSKLFEIFFAKMMADKKLEWKVLNSTKQIEWTLIRLPFVKDSLKTNLIKENLTDMPGTKISNKDIARFIIDHLDNPKYVHKAPFIAH
ncbi:NAD(P)-dependent oxidoreductase [Rummeliibacillus pycnus]|uniref:NAD(P)-dependent oxidoreductase n=1 Tax=Rummeliibacillus pycnus TaxID=101070 RepID=UPI000C9C5D73|nr:NAD(P)H-binding protein [Rummeliibacillus pycnus]